MDLTVAVGPQDRLDTTSPSGLACPSPAKAEAGTAAASICWMSARSEYWPGHDQPGVPPDWNMPESVLGVACLVFGIGVSGAEWVDRLVHSGWFAGLQPRPEDMTAGGEAIGGWCLPGRCTGSQHDIAGAARAFFEHGPLPNAPLATVAIMPNAGQGDVAAALGLVAALRERRCERGCRTAVVVTVEGSTSPALLLLVRKLRDLGAFIVRPGMAAGGDHLHHFPLRAAMVPRAGRLVCTDLADHLACWPPRGVADLHVIPSAYDAAERVFRMLADTGHAGGRVSARAINLHLHLGADAPDSALVRIDRLAASCHGFLAPDGNIVLCYNLMTAAEQACKLTRRELRKACKEKISKTN